MHAEVIVRSEPRKDRPHAGSWHSLDRLIGLRFHPDRYATGGTDPITRGYALAEVKVIANIPLGTTCCPQRIRRSNFRPRPLWSEASLAILLPPPPPSSSSSSQISQSVTETGGCNTTVPAARYHLYQLSLTKRKWWIHKPIFIWLVNFKKLYF